MRSREIQRLIDAVEAVYGPVILYGSGQSEEHGTCFKIAGIPATVSVHTQDGDLPSGQYDVQIEGVPPGDYIFATVLSLEALLEQMARLRGPEDAWPGLDAH